MSTMTRRQMREHLLKLLYLRDFHSLEELDEQNSLYFELFTDVIEEDSAKILQRYKLIVDRLPEIDHIITDAMSGWKLSRIGKLELNLMRIAVYEIRFDNDVPDKAAINEAVDIAKSYCSEDSSYGFINGVLANVIRKNQESSQ